MANQIEPNQQLRGAGILAEQNAAAENRARVKANADDAVRRLTGENAHPTSDEHRRAIALRAAIDAGLSDGSVGKLINDAHSIDEWLREGKKP